MTVPHLTPDAPVMVLIARLHASTTLADRVRRQRAHREGVRIGKLKRKKGKENET